MPATDFSSTARFYIPELEAEQARFSISGQVNFPARIQSSGDVETIVVVFHPHAIGTMFNIPVSAFYNQEIDGYSLGDKRVNILADDVLNADDSDEAIKMIEKWLLSRLEKPAIYNFKRVGASLQQLFLDNSINVDGMAQLACLSRKQFERVFFNAVGMKPKEYSRVARFQKSLWLIQNGKRDFADGTSALAQYDIDGAVGMYSGIFNNPFMIWGRYRKRLIKTTLTVSFQFHHTQMDGAHAARFLDLLQHEIDSIH